MTLADRFGDAFRLISETRENHTTPKGAVERFVYAVFEKI